MSFRCRPSIILFAYLGLAAAAAAEAAAPAEAGIDLAVTVGTDLSPDACAPTSTLDAIVGDEVNFCYRVTNHAAVPLRYQTLDDSIDGSILSESDLVIAPGATVQYNRIRQVSDVEAGLRTATWTARDVRPDYLPTARAGDFVDIASSPTATDLNPAGDAGDPTGAGMAAVEMPFSFPFYGVTADRLCVGVDGVVLIGTDSCILFPSPNGLPPLPTAGLGASMVVLWDDFAGKESFCDDDCVDLWGTVYADTIGTAPNRKFVIEWFNLRHSPGAANEDRATFELVIDEATGALTYEYLDVQYTAYGNSFGEPDVCNDGACASIGLQQDDGWAYSYSNMQASIIDDSAIDWIPNAPTAYSAEASVTLNVGKPVIALPSTIAASAGAGSSATATLTLSNAGDRDLHWTIDQGIPAAAGPAGEAVPAYVARLLLADFPSMDNTLLGFDAGDPESNAPVGSIYRIYEAGTFVDDDFSTAYFVGGWHEVGGTHIFTTEVLERVDTATAEITTVGDTGIGPYESIQGLTWDPTTSTLYAVIPTQDGSTTTLASVDRYTGAVTRLVPVTGSDFLALVGLAIDSTGRLFSIDQNSSTLIEIDKATGAARTVGPLGDESILLLTGPLAFDRTTDTLYMTGATPDLYGGVYTVDLGTGHASLAGTLGIDQQLASALAIATAGGPCVGTAAAPWLSFDPAQGTVPAGGSQDVAIGFDASALGEGTYEADLCVRSDDPYRHTAPVHVTLEVGAVADAIFSDGFEQ